ncbi:phosphate signaling complex protein PhoU [Moritella yayanosii]|uniref:Phosphate-specific transport system accessory protein PhoU n=1 Tax=Moritella yayanosii TaxID=69539 RepID=A0A330LWZ7_9GAMM|nr:phosphate signaling complex protein PhoU [Moritella yayanosii]SQD80248.1 negative regulator of PhoR/PhoB two-component regulator [Moritella yayanosii]
MDNLTLGRHISGQFNAELESIRNQVMVMGGLVEEQLNSAIEVLTSQDLDMANKIIGTDKSVNSMEVAVDEACTRIIAKRQPAASDLRLVMAIIKTITDLERIGDVAARIARTVIENRNKKSPPLVSVENMGRHTVKMLHDVLDAFARMDVDAAFKVYQEDAKVDREYESIIRELMTYMMEDPRSIPQVLNVLWCVRSLERVGDRCQNISEYIIYFVKGKDIRHINHDEVRDLLAK